MDMMSASVLVPFGEGRKIVIQIPDNSNKAVLKSKISRVLGLSTSQFGLCKSGCGKKNNYTVYPTQLKGAIDEELLMDEYNFLRHQFPLVTMKNLTTYEGMVRCEGGPVKEFAEQGIWPFEQYVEWQKFKIKLAYLHPYKPPKVTWLTDIDHPNIIPNRTGKVCVSLLGKGWLPETKLAAVVNALYFLLFDPNPYSHYPNRRCTKVAEICKQYGFPRKRGGILARHENTLKCPHCRKPFIIEDPEAKVVQCIHCKILLMRKSPDEVEQIR
jgi:hypothetical protein